jgi:hypothetical protein
MVSVCSIRHHIVEKVPDTILLKIIILEAAGTNTKPSRPFLWCQTPFYVTVGKMLDAILRKMHLIPPDLSDTINCN